MSTFFSGGRGFVVVLVVVTAGIGATVWWLRSYEREADMVAVLHANNRGIGYMERFEYDKAVEAFEKVTAMAPKWRPGQINLGIALLNAAGVGKLPPKDLDRAVAIFQKILKDDPDNLHAHHCLGVIFKYRKAGEAVQHFERVTELDPTDAHAWFFLGLALPQKSTKRLECFQKAVDRNPYLAGAIYALSQELRRKDAKAQAEALQKLQDKLKLAYADVVAGEPYSQSGRYTEVIGRIPQEVEKGAPLPLFEVADKFQVRLAPGTRWATQADFKGPEADLRRAVRQRFGGTLVFLDYNKDGKPDIFLLGAVVRNGQVEDLLLANRGQGVFEDVTAKAGLGGPRVSLGCCVGDFDNDGYPDLLITGVGGPKLFRNVPGKEGKFADVTREAGLDEITSVCLGSAFVDIDQDGDLDLLIAQLGATAAEALANLTNPQKGPGWAFYLNVGEALPNPTNQEKLRQATGQYGIRELAPLNLKPLRPKFRKAPGQTGFPEYAMAAINLAVSDLDGDRDLDVVLFGDAGPARLVLNDRLLRFRAKDWPDKILPKGKWNGAVVLDFNRDERSDMFVIGPGQAPLLLINHPGKEKDFDKWFTAGHTNSPPLRQAQAIDLDLDGRTDVVGLTDKGRPVYLHNDGKRLVVVPEGLGPDSDWPKDLVAVAAADLDGDWIPDLITWSEKTGLSLRRSLGNGNHGLPVRLVGYHYRPDKMRCNAEGHGSRLIAQAGGLWSGLEMTTLTGGLGQSEGMALLGLGLHAQADVLRIRWLDSTWQAEMSLPANQLATVFHLQRLNNSCPILFTWNGERFVFVTDFLGAGAIGESLPDGSHRPPRPEESLLIESHQLVPQDGRFVLKISESRDEVTYLDRLQLIVVDHPQELKVQPDERFAIPGPSQDLLVHAAGQEIHPVKAVDHQGRDVTAVLRHWDRAMVDGFAKRSWLGFAEEHWVELDFGDRLSHLGPKDPVALCLAGWTDYPYPESIWAATQAGVALVPPCLERLGPDGKWRMIRQEAGFPAGLPRRMVMDLTGHVHGPACRLRLRTNMQVFWDQIFVAPILERIPAGAQAPVNSKIRTTPLAVQKATLEARGCVQEFSPDGQAAIQFNYDRLDRVPVTRLSGKLTKLGDVTALLHERDDRFVIFGPGDEVTVSFAADGLPPPPAGWTRSYVLRTWGYCKDCGPFTASGGTVEPLPFHGMKNFPYGLGEAYPRTPAHDEYRRQYNTRVIGPVVR